MTEIQEKTPVEPTAVAQPVTPQPVNGLAVASLITGIVAFISGWIPFWGLLVGIAAVVLGILGLKKIHGKGLAIAGISTGALGALAGLLATVFFIIAVVSSATFFDDTYNDERQTQTQEDRQLFDAKKNFSKGETALLGVYEVKANSVQRNYVPETGTRRPAAAKEFILVNLTIKNTDTKDAWVTMSTFDLNDGTDSTNGLSVPVPSSSRISKKLTPGASVTGYVVYEVEKDATDLKLEYEKRATSNSETYQRLLFTLEI